MSRARLSTQRDAEFEIVQVTDDAAWVLRDDRNDVVVFEESSPTELVEVRCDFCGRWSHDAAPVAALNWSSWMCFGGTGCAEQ